MRALSARQSRILDIARLLVKRAAIPESAAFMLSETLRCRHSQSGCERLVLDTKAVAPR